MVGECSPSVVLVNTGLAEKHGALFAIPTSLFFVAVFATIFLRPRNFFKQLMELQEVIDEEGRLESTHSLVWLLCCLATDRAWNEVLASLYFNRKTNETIVTKGVKTWQCPGVSVPV